MLTTSARGKHPQGPAAGSAQHYFELWSHLSWSITPARYPGGQVIGAAGVLLLLGNGGQAIPDFPEAHYDDSVKVDTGRPGGQVDGAAGVLLRMHHTVARDQLGGVHTRAALLPGALRRRVRQVRSRCSDVIMS